MAVIRVCLHNRKLNLLKVNFYVIILYIEDVVEKITNKMRTNFENLLFKEGILKKVKDEQELKLKQ